MDRNAFKQRMQNLKSYRENNPGKDYWDWRNSLPDNLKYTDDTEYDMVGAYNSGAQPTLEDDGSYHYLPDVIMPPSQDSYNIEDILSEDQINAIKLFEDKKYFTQEEAHEVIEFLIRRCYELGATKNY